MKPSDSQFFQILLTNLCPQVHKGVLTSRYIQHKMSVQILFYFSFISIPIVLTFFFFCISLGMKNERVPSFFKINVIRFDIIY